MTLYPDDNILPNGEPEVGLHNGKFTNGDPTNGINPSHAWAPHVNLLTDNLQVAIEAVGTSNNKDTNQILNAIRLIIHPVGTIQMWSFPEADLPFGWYRCDGLAVRLSSAQGQALQGLSASFRSAWNLVVDTSDADPANHTITRPNLIGEFIRAIDGTNRDIGSKQTDALQDHSHVEIRISTGQVPDYSKSMANQGEGLVWSQTSYRSLSRRVYSETDLNPNYGHPPDSAGSARVEDETRPKNVGMTPAIFLNV